MNEMNGMQPVFQMTLTFWCFSLRPHSHTFCSAELKWNTRGPPGALFKNHSSISHSLLNDTSGINALKRTFFWSFHRAGTTPCLFLPKSWEATNIFSSSRMLPQWLAFLRFWCQTAALWFRPGEATFFSEVAVFSLFCKGFRRREHFSNLLFIFHQSSGRRELIVLSLYISKNNTLWAFVRQKCEIIGLFLPQQSGWKMTKQTSRVYDTENCIGVESPSGAESMSREKLI